MYCTRFIACYINDLDINYRTFALCSNVIMFEKISLERNVLLVS